jgi:hypothetical protein
MADEVKILEIEFDNAIKQIQELTGAVDKLKSEQKELATTTGTTSKEYIEVSAQLKVTTTELRANQKVVENSIKANKGSGDSIASLRAQLSNAKKAYSELTAAERENEKIGGALLKRTADLNSSLKELEGAYGDNQRKVGDYTGAINQSLNSVEGLQQRIKDLNDQAKTLDLNSKEFKDTTDEARNLQLQVDQALGKVNEFGERVPKNPVKKAFGDTLVTVGLLASGLQTLSAQFTDNEDAQAALAKSAQALAVATTVANIAKEKGAIIDTVNLAVTKAQSIAQLFAAKTTGVLTAATRLFGITATQAWAAATLGLSLLIAGIVALIANFDKVTRAVKDFFGIAEDNSKKLAESYKRQNEELEQQEKILNRTSDAVTRDIQRRIKLEEAAGKDTTKLRQQLFNQSEKFLKAEIKLIEQRILLEAASLSPEKAREAYNLRLKLQEQLNDLVVDFQAKNIAAETKIREESAKTTKERLENEKKRIEELVKEETRATRAIRDLQIELIDDQIEKEKELIKEKFKRLIEDEKNAAVIVLLKQKEQKELADLEKKITIDRLNEQVKRATDENALLDARLAANERYRQRLALINQGISEDAQNQLLATDEATLQRLAGLTEFFGVTQQQIFDQYQAALEENENLTFERFVETQELILAKEFEINQQRLALATNFGAALGDILADSIADTENGLESFGRGFTLLILDVLQKQILAAIAASTAQSFAQPDSVATFGAAGAIRAGILTAAIQGAFGVVKSQISKPPKGFATGVVGLNGPGTATSDSIPAYLSKGETVLPAWATEKIQTEMPGFLESHVGAPKFATGVVNFNPTPSIGDQFSILEALRTLPAPKVLVSDIEKGFNNAREVQVLGSL